MRYIETNPLRAQLVEHPAEYLWSSYTANAQGTNSSLIQKHPVYLSLDNDNNNRLKNYRDLFQQHINEELLEDIRNSLNQELVLGRSNFKDKIDQITSRQTRRAKAGRPKVEDERGVYIVNY